jgi:hypothetical protein
MEPTTIESITPEPVVASEPERNELIGSHRKRDPERWRWWAPEVIEAMLQQLKTLDSGVNPDCDCCGS